MGYEAFAFPLEFDERSCQLFSCQEAQIPPCKSFTRHMRMAGTEQGCQLVLDHHHDSGHICGRLMGPFVETNISLVQCMVWTCMQAVLLVSCELAGDRGTPRQMLEDPGYELDCGCSFVSNPVWECPVATCCRNL
jgi:hypothetical protein